jgi:hypothetical protein
VKEDEEDNSSDRPNSKTKRKRRCTKNDPTPRAYKCGCGRGYYSYPALYTHLKFLFIYLFKESSTMGNHQQGLKFLLISITAIEAGRKKNVDKDVIIY